MDTKKFENYFKDNQIIKFSGWQGGHYLHSDTNAVVFFAFFHVGITNYIHGHREKRIIFDTFSLNNYQGPFPLPHIISEQYFLVNSNYPDFAMLFKVTIDGDVRTAKLTLEEYPEHLDSIITDEERIGIELKIK